MVFGQQNIGEAFIVAQHIIARLHFLNQIGFQKQGVGFGFGADEFHIAGCINHPQNTIIVTRRAGIGRTRAFKFFALPTYSALPSPSSMR